MQSKEKLTVIQYEMHRMDFIGKLFYAMHYIVLAIVTSNENMQIMK